MKKAIFLSVLIIFVVQGRVSSQTCQSACSANYQMQVADYINGHAQAGTDCDNIPLPEDIAAEAADEIAEGKEQSPEVAAGLMNQTADILACNNQNDAAFGEELDAATAAQAECMAGCN